MAEPTTPNATTTTPVPEIAPVAVPTAVPVPAAPARKDSSSELVIVYQHSSLFYWWPIWALGFLFALATWWGDYHMAIVPAKTEAVTESDGLKRDILVLPEGKKHLTRKDAQDRDVVQAPTIFVTRYRGMGTVFLIVLLLVIFITNVPLRGLWSMIACVTILMLSIIFWLSGWWEVIFERLGNLSIYINLGGYLLIATVLLILWCISFFLLDRQLYVVFSPGQVRLCLEIGGGETIYDAIGMVVHQQRSDLFRHLILGFGSGDLELRFPKVEHPILLHNVLNISKVVSKIDRLVQEKVIVTETAPLDKKA